MKQVRLLYQPYQMCIRDRDIAASFSVMQDLAERLSLKEIQFKNLIQTEEDCIEWHAIYDDEDMNTWKFGVIHIRKGSKYDGVVEKVTVAITKQLTPEIKNTILQIKFDVPDGIQIDVYKRQTYRSDLNSVDTGELNCSGWVVFRLSNSNSAPIKDNACLLYTSRCV